MDERTGLPTVGMIGGGYLTRLTHQAAISLGQSLRVLVAPGEDRASLAAPQVHLGDHADPAVLREFAEGCDVVTFSCDDVRVESLRTLLAAGVPVAPGPDALAWARSRPAVRRHLAGRHVAVLDGPPPRGRRLAVTVARSPFGQLAVYPLAETTRSDSDVTEVTVPPRGLPEELTARIHLIAVDLVTQLGLVGLLTVELVETGAGLVFRGLAVRPHRSGCWTVEGSRTSQFEQHLRAVLDYPLGRTELTAPAVVTTQVSCGEPGGMSLDERLHHLLAADPQARVHLYGRPTRAGDLIGHVTVLGEHPQELSARAARAARWLREGR